MGGNNNQSTTLAGSSSGNNKVIMVRSQGGSVSNLSPQQLLQLLQVIVFNNTVNTIYINAAYIELTDILIFHEPEWHNLSTQNN